MTAKMRVDIGFDDTDIVEADYGTGKAARRFEKILPAPGQCGRACTKSR